MPLQSPLRAAIEKTREELAKQRQHIRELHDRGADGQRICSKLASLVDSALIRLLDEAFKTLPDEQASAFRGGIAVVGLGSYGRRQMAPYSDVDVMILHDAKDPESLKTLVRPFIQSLFDVGFDVGYSVRTVAESIALAKDDPVIATSQIGARLIAGSQRLHEEFRANFAKSIRRRPKASSLAFLDARREERKKYGETVYMLEPNVKRSRGGLRDLHLLQWLGYVEQGEFELDRLRLLGAMSKFEHRRLSIARTYLLRLRNEMHFHADRLNDTLNRAEQLRLAEVFGHTRRGGLLPVEHFMRDYFRHTKHLWDMVRRREAGLQSPTTVERLLDPVVGRTRSGDYRVGVKNISITATGKERIRSSLAAVIAMIAASAESGKPFDHAAWSALLLAAPDCPSEMNREIADGFMQLLDDPRAAGHSLRVLNELGYLEKIVPAMKHVRCLLQFNQYHKYTVDEHSLRAVQAVGEFYERQDALGKACREVKERRYLHLALLLHDLGKGFEEDHSEVGRRIAKETCQRLMIDDRNAEMTEMLVHKHLVMSHLAFRRDTSDPEVLERFATEVGSSRRLRMLFVLTCADLEAVGPGVLNDWKIDVLASVYQQTLPFFETDDISHSELELNVHRSKVTALLSQTERQDPWYQEQVDVLPASYLAARDLTEVAQALRALRKLPHGQAVAWGRYFPDTKTLEFVAGVSEGVGQGAFSSMAGALTSQGLKILAADVEILARDLLILRYVAVDPQHAEATPQSRLDEVSQLLTEAIHSDQTPRFPKVWGQEQAEASMQLTALPNQVKIDNELSQKGTVVEVFTFDRAGLLYALARKLHDLDLTIRHAKIGTYLDQVVDVFYVTDRLGEKLTDERQLARIREEMLSIVENRG